MVRALFKMLENTARQGSLIDTPEGSRYIQISDTLAKQMTEAVYVMVFCGADVTEAEQAKAEEIIRAAAPNSEVAVLPGGQPLYPYIEVYNLKRGFEHLSNILLCL